ILLSVIGVIVSGGCLIGVSTFVSSYLKIPIAYFDGASESFYILCLTVPVVTLTGTLRGFLEASDRFLYISIVTGLSGVSMYGLPALVVLMGGGLVAVAAAFALVRVAMCGALAIGCLRVEGRTSLRPILDVTAVRRMLSFGGWLFVSDMRCWAMIYCGRVLLWCLWGESPGTRDR